MKAKAFTAALAATLLGLSAASFAQTTPGTRGPTAGSTGQDNPGANETPATGTATGAGAGVTPGVATSSCASLTGAARDRCLRDDATRGASSGSYIPQRPSQSMDKQDPVHPNTKAADQAQSRGQ